jgi:hypothetical protein
MDSLLHSRHHLKHFGLDGYSIDALCVGLGVDVDPVKRHDAAYDVDVLCKILYAVQERCECPYISGASQPLHELSAMLVRGIGPSVWAALPVTGLRDLCSAIIDHAGDLAVTSCIDYLGHISLRSVLPLADLESIARGVEDAGIRYLHYRP